MADLLTSRETAAALNVSVARVAAMMREGHLVPAYDAGGRRLYDRGEVARVAADRRARAARGERVKVPAI
jgi:DNA-binding transcriptional MerR regulator